MKNSIYIIFVISIFTPFVSNGQSGYLGSKNNLNIELGFTKVLNNSNNRVDKAEMNGTSSVVYSVPNFKFNLSASYTRVINNNYRIDFGMNFMKLNLFTPYYVDTIYITNGFDIETSKYAVLNTIPIKYNSVNIGFRKFYAGHSPVGKFWGLDLTYGKAKTEQIIPIKIGLIYGKQKQSKGYFYDVIYYNERTLNYQGNLEVLNLNFVIGRTIPLTQKLGVNVILNASIVKLFHYNNTYETGFTLNKASVLDYNSTLGLNRQIALTLRNSNSFRINFGLCYFI